MIYEKYKQGALAAVKTFVTNQSGPQGQAPVTGRSHLLNSKLDPLSLRPQLENPFDQSDRAKSLAQESLSSNLKLGLDQSRPCTSCKKPQHYGNCSPYKKGEYPFLRMKLKEGQFNRGMLGSDSTQQDSHYTAGNSFSGKLQQNTSINPEQQIGSAFKTFQEAYETMVAGESDHSYGGLDKTAEQEILGPTINPYAERLTRLRPITLNRETAKDQISKMFDSFKMPTDSGTIENTMPESGPLM